jgi:hypothetical protein
VFKTMAILGFLAGGAAFAIYHHGGFGCHDGDCPLSRGACCDGGESDGTLPPCCQGKAASCCELTSPCCATSEAGEAVLIGAVGPKTGSCCAASGAACCELGGDCCAGGSAKEAVAGPAARFAKAAK